MQIRTGPRGIKRFMVIECGKCKTRFHLADGRLSSKGARVRCSNCHHRFHVTPPPATPTPTSDAPEHSASQTLESSSALPPSTSAGDPDLDNPEFLFDEPGPSTSTTAPSLREAQGGPQLDFEQVPDLATEQPPEQIEEDSEPAECKEDPPVFERDSQMIGVEPSAPESEEPVAARGVSLSEDDDMPILEVERNQKAAPSPISDVESFEDVLGKDLDDDEDDSWESLAVPTTPAAAQPSEPAGPAGTDNVLAAAHKVTERDSTRFRPAIEHVPEVEFEAPARRRGAAIIQILALGLGVIVSLGVVHTTWTHGLGEIPGPAAVKGAGWTATEIEAFHTYDPSRRRLFVLRGTLKAESASPVPLVQVTLIDAKGQPLGAPKVATVGRRDDPLLDPLGGEGAAFGPRTAPEKADGFTLILPEPAPGARRFLVELIPS